MATLPDRDLPLLHAEPAMRHPVSKLAATALKAALPLTLCLMIAGLLRGWGSGASFESSDQAMMPYLVRHSFGATWVFAHSYGPVPVIVHASVARILSHLGIPMDEAVSRLPVAVLSITQVFLAYLLMRRLHCTRNLATAASLVCALLPPLVTDGHYAWGYLTIWLLFGTTALWAALAYMDDRQTWHLSVASFSLFAHCLSNCFVFGVPLTLLIIWVTVIRRAKQARRRVINDALFGFALPCLAAFAVAVMCRLGTGGGQIGRLLAKQHAGVMGWSPTGMLKWLAIWSSQYGYLFVVPATAGLFHGVVLAKRGDRRGLLAIWAYTAFLPLLLLSNPSRIGYPGAYLMEPVFAGGMLAVVLFDHLWNTLSRRTLILKTAFVAACLLSIAHLGFGSIDSCLAGSRFRHWTGVTTGWGSLTPDSGIKAAGWYVRQYVPPDAVIMPLHTNRGMEAPVAEYYLGRRVLAAMDVNADHLKPLLAAVVDHVDLVIAEPEYREMIEKSGDFVAVCTFTRNGQAVRMIYARPAMQLPEMVQDVAVVNPQYDRLFAPSRVPLPLPAAPAYKAKMDIYLRALRHLKSGRAPGPESGPAQ
ncbi:MAG TPA: hypothetical protein PLL20_09305 [Phycisphaerae bacterium]|nr:hypothetical protein [Phycisphaerae bacterium]HRR86571.1 hypothetical protein [Phycisphaerae bacterium]